MAVQRDSALTSEMGQGFWGSRVAIAIVIGVPLCCVLALLYTNGELPVYDWPARLGRLSGSGYRTGSTSSESQGRVDALSIVIVSQAKKITELEMRVENLTEKLRLAEKGQDDARKQLRPGPFGTVKGLRTNPTVIPNETANPRLAELLKEVAVGKELIVALANSNVRETLEIWFTSIKRVGIPNYMVVALDNETAEFCRSNEVPVYQRDPDQEIDAIGKTGTNSAISGLKFRVLREFLQLGYSVLLSDADVVHLQNPFNHLYRDSDVESMTDGHDNGTAYGYNDVFNDPVMGRSSIIFTRRIWDYNAGFFYIRPTIPSIELLDRVTGRLILQPDAWDQAVYNEELFYPSHPGYEGLHIAKRTMDYYLFMNSKVLFREVRKDAQLSEMKPVNVHLNYHGDKLPRMKAVVEFYLNGNKDALQPFPDGS